MKTVPNVALVVAAWRKTLVLKRVLVALVVAEWKKILVLKRVPVALVVAVRKKPLVILKRVPVALVVAVLVRSSKPLSWTLLVITFGLNLSQL
jgi:hypothetical protein